jgi:hypothetical protein
LVGAADAVEPNLVAHWKFDEGAGTIAYDSAGDNDGTLVNGPTWTVGQIGGALDFDGDNDYVVVADDESQQITTNQITLSAWIKLDADVGNTQRRIICKQEAACISWGLEIFGDGYYGSTGNQLVFHDSDGKTAWRNCISPTDLGLSQWYHVAVTDNAGEIRIYLDGQLNQSSNGGYGIPENISAPINIGCVENDKFFNGVIDDVRIYDRALSAEEILALMGPAPELTALEVTGPDEVPDNSTAQFYATAYYDDDSTKDVTASAQWSVDNNEIAQINSAGLLTTNELLTLDDEIAISADYSSGDVNVSDQKPVVVHADCTVAELVERNIDGALAIKDEIIVSLDEALEREKRAGQLLEEFRNDPSFENWSRKDFMNSNRNLNMAIWRELLGKWYIHWSIRYLQEIGPGGDNAPPSPGHKKK